MFNHPFFSIETLIFLASVASALVLGFISGYRIRGDEADEQTHDSEKRPAGPANYLFGSDGIVGIISGVIVAIVFGILVGFWVKVAIALFQ